jgi:hypothetical protein
VALVAEAPAIEALFEAGDNIGELGKKVFEKYAKQASREIGQSIQHKLEAVGQTVQLVKEQFGEKDFVSHKDVASAVVAAVELAAPASVKPFIKVAKGVGLDDVAAENLADLVPKEVVDGINDAIRQLAKTLDPAISEAEKTVMSVLGKVGDEFAKEFPKDLGDFFAAPVQLDRHAGAAAAGERAGGRALERADRLLRSSSGQPLPPEVRAEMQERLGFSFDDVRVHTGGDAAAAANLLGANALTHGRDIYFGAGRFAPATADGRRLLAHELTHVVQQRGAGADTGDAAAADTPVQREGDFIESRARIFAKKWSAKAREKLKEGLKIATGGSPQFQADAKKSRDWAAGMVQGNRKVVSKTDPMLPAGYYYSSFGKRPVIKRRLAYIRYLPELTVTKDGLIRYGILARLHGYEDRARAELRRNLRCGNGEQAHHIIPLGARGHDLVKAAMKDGWNINASSNGICLSTEVHDGPHKNYTTAVTADLELAWRELKRERREKVRGAAKAAVEEVAGKHHEQLEHRKERLD